LEMIRSTLCVGARLTPNKHAKPPCVTTPYLDALRQTVWEYVAVSKKLADGMGPSPLAVAWLTA